MLATHKLAIRAAAALVAAMALSTLACGDGATEPPATPTPSAVWITPATIELSALGDTARLSADVRDQQGQPMAGAAVTWTSGAPEVATVDGQGLLTTVGNGSATITASAGSASGSAKAWVAQEVRAVSVSAPGPVLVDDTLRLVAEALDANGHAVAGSEFSWASSDTTVATVDASGLVTGLASGEAEVTAASSGATGGVEVAVRSATTVSVSPSREAIPLGDTLRLVAEALDENGQPLAGVRFSWSSSRPEMASVDQSGLVTGVAEGSATITATGAGAAGAADIAVANPDRAALVALYNATDGPNWVNNDNWLTDAPLHEWFGVHTDDSGRVVRLYLNENELSGPVPTELGTLNHLIAIALIGNDLTGTIPAELGALSSLFALHLPGNSLTGTIPPELGDLRSLEWLNLAHNDLEGTIPKSLVGLDLKRFRWDGNHGLCAPGVREFAEWLQGVEDVSGPFCDVAALERLFEVAGGSAWTNAEGWLGGPVLDDWHGIRTDSLGRVTALDLTANGLAGRLPPQLGDLVRMTRLRVGGNALSGWIPPELVNLVNLTEFHYNDTDLCIPSDAAFRNWLNGVRDHQGTGVDCPANLDRAALVALYNATDGPNWVNNDNWLTDAPLGDWNGVRTDDFGRVVYLALALNNLSGPIPPELGNLSNLKLLNLWANDLSGAIPPELGNLSNLESLFLGRNRFVRGNNLSGTIPPELGGLSNLKRLSLASNDLSGPIPPELGGLPNLKSLSLANNDLSGTIPPGLGGLSNLDSLSLANNDLSGTIPRSLVGLDVKQFHWDGNLGGLCAPGVREFAVWLQGVDDVLGPFCNQSDVAALEGLFEVAGGSAWTNAKGWLGGPALDDWHGIRADSLGRVTTLDLTANGLAGRLPSQLGDLVRMTRLRVGGNALSGSIPPLGKLVDLTELDLGDNELSGRIPRELGNLVNLTELDLSDNALSGSIPRELGNLVNLTEFDYHGTDVCVPSDAALRNWLNGVRDHRGTGVDCTQTGAAELARFLRENPRVAVAMTWLGTDHRAKPYDEWPQALKDKLVLAAGQLTGGGGTGLPDVPINRAAESLADEDRVVTVLSKEDAEDLYVANVANSLLLEMSGALPWSLDDLSERELELLLGSAGFFSYFQRGSVTGYVVAGFATPAPPELIREFLEAKDIVGDSRYETIVTLMDWAQWHLGHAYGGRTVQNAEAHWGYRGVSPVALMLTRRTLTTYRWGDELRACRDCRRYWTSGCHGTNWFLKHMLRAVNIPVAYERKANHATPSFPSEALYLSHGDDLLNAPAGAIPPLPEAFPISEMLIDEWTYREWFGESNSHEERLRNIGRRPVELAVKHLAPRLLAHRCRDLSSGVSKDAVGSVYYHWGMQRYWTVEELEAMRFWERMDAKIEQYGGCPIAPPYRYWVPPRWR